jgi:HSP20 family protein
MGGLTPFNTKGFLEEFFRDTVPGGYWIKPLHGDGLPAQIKVDVKESVEAYTVHAEIPGVKKEDIHVSLEGGMVTLSAEIKQQDAQRQNEKLLRSERYYGSVSRSFQLPQEVDVSTAKALYENGVLVLMLPKKTKASSRTLKVD